MCTPCFNSGHPSVGSVAPVTPATAAPSSVVTVLASQQHEPDGSVPLMQKKYWLNDDGQLKMENFQDAYLYDVQAVSVTGIREFSRLIDAISQRPTMIIIRGQSLTQQLRKTRRRLVDFDEPAAGIPWVMVDFDHIPLPDGLDPLSTSAFEYVVAKLPAEFHGVSYYYQFSNSAGVLQSDGTPLKPGFNGHAYFWLNRPIHGKKLTAYLKRHCIVTGFYEHSEKDAGRIIYGVDPSPINNAVLPHYTATPDIGPGVSCLLPHERRQGLVVKASDLAEIPELPDDIISIAQCLQNKVVNDHKKALGFMKTVTQAKVGNGISTVWHYASPSSNQATGRPFVRGKLSADDKYFTLYFSDEKSPGSWYVQKDKPEFARHFGGDMMLLKDLSPDAHAYVRDELKWFVEIPHRQLKLTEQGYLPAIAGFAHAKVSTILAPTKSGKTKAAIDWCSALVKEKALVIYSATTVALVNQMKADLKSSFVPVIDYHDTKISGLPVMGVIVTTNQSLKHILRLANEANRPYYLIVDEIHMGLDEFMQIPHMNQLFENAMVKSTQTLLLTGTLTDVQRSKLPNVVGHALSGLTEAHYCGYEFPAVRQNPLYIRPTDRFDNDFMQLMEGMAAKLKAGEPLPRVVILLDTTKLNVYRKILSTYGLTEHAHVVSRPENTAAQIDAARVSTLPILISSPLFAYGLNFERPPELLICRFCGIKADTSQIVQAVNRGNRTHVLCKVVVYGNPVTGARFNIPDKAKLKGEITTQLKTESTFTGLLEEHHHLDRLTYKVLRDCERNSSVALSLLIEDNSIQNYTVTEMEELPDYDKKKAAIFKAQRQTTREEYLSDIRTQAKLFTDNDIADCFKKLEWLQMERKEAWSTYDSRVELEIRNEELGIVMALCNLADPQAANKVKIVKLKCLFGLVPPWTSAQFDQETNADWKFVTAEKTGKLLVLIEKLHELQTEKITAVGMASSLTRNKQLPDAFLALASCETEFIKMDRTFSTLKKARERSKVNGSAAAKAKVRDDSLILLHGLLEGLGVVYLKKRNYEGRMVIDYESPVVPANWNLPLMAFNLKRRVKHPDVEYFDNVFSIGSDDEFPGERLVPLRICKGCVNFHQNSCSHGRPVAWQGDEYEINLAEGCRSFCGIKSRMAA